MSHIHLLSVVVIGRNEGERLQRCLASVQEMQTDGWKSEYFYVDSGSTDDSLAIAERNGFQVIALQADRPTAAKGRNAGWRAASGDTILFLDGDTVLHPEFVRKASVAFEDPSVAVVWGHRRELFPKQSIYNRVMDLDWIYAPGYTPFCGGDALFRRETLEALEGFDESLIAGEEPELCRRILARGEKILHVDLPMTGHDLALRSFRSYWQRAERAGHAYAEVAQRFARTQQAFWQDEVQRNQRRALILLSMPGIALILAAAFASLWPLLALALFLLAIVLRTAVKARWKSNDSVTLLLYGVHSQFQQIPIFFGQRRFARNYKAGRRAELLEYK